MGGRWVWWAWDVSANRRGGIGEVAKRCMKMVLQVHVRYNKVGGMEGGGRGKISDI